MYLGKASFGSTYGAAGSLVIVLVWVYYSAQIFFFGAEFTQAYAKQFGSDPLRKRHATDKPKAVTPQPAPREVPAAYAASAAGAVGSVLGGALVVSRIVSLFRSKKS